MAYINRDTSQWNKTSDEGRFYETTFNLRSQGSSISAVGGSVPNFTRVKVKTNLDTGNFTVVRVIEGAEDTPIYTYDASTDGYTIINQSLYEDIFEGITFNGIDLTTNYDYLNRISKISTLSLSAKEVSESNINFEKDAELKQQTGYISLSNIAPLPPEDRTDGSEPTNSQGLQRPNNPTINQDNISSFNIDLPNQGNFSQRRNYGGSILRYPLEVPNLGYDFIKIGAFEYAAGTILASGFGAPAGSVVLPMQPGIAEQSTVQWDKDTLNFIQASLANISMGAAQSVGDLDISAIQSALQEEGANVSNILNQPGLKGDIAAYFAGQAVGSNILGRSQGKVVNPNMELLFRGPDLRKFNFAFELTPRSSSEANSIREIIRFFKRNMAVKKGGGLFLNTPNIFKVEYIYNGGGQHPFLNKIKPCACTSFAVDYTPDGNYMTYADGGSMTRYKIQFSMNELFPIYQSDHDNSGTSY